MKIKSIKLMIIAAPILITAFPLQTNGWISNKPPTFSNLNQYKSDGITAILEGCNDANNDKICDAP